MYNKPSNHLEQLDDRVMGQITKLAWRLNQYDCDYGESRQEVRGGCLAIRTNICWNSLPAKSKTNDTFLTYLADNFIFQKLEEVTWCTAILDLILTIKEELVADLEMNDKNLGRQ